ncbi:MAG TPA: 50S ribosomal protein L11 methyltransferase [Chitinophagales bacterium]|nr:50S ribosomal protein L11 methyltransferase [Chitinophagales bacterium]
MMQYIEYHFTADENTVEILLALLADLGFDTFEQDNNTLFAYILEKDHTEELKHEIENLQSQFIFNYKSQSIAEKNWNEEWEKNFQPVNVENRCLIRATFHPEQTGFEEVIVIEPRMAFGTGHHDSTYLMIQEMMNMDFKNKQVCDAGSGTGILAILAAKRGADFVFAIDNNEWAYHNAIDNIGLNEVVDIIETELGELDMLTNKSFDIILANINKTVIQENITLLSNAIKKDGIVLISGILIPDLQDITSAAEKAGLHLYNSWTRNEWISAVFTKS